MLLSAVVGCASTLSEAGGEACCDWRMTKEKENISSSSLFSLRRKFGGPPGLDGSGSCYEVLEAVKRSQDNAQTDLDVFNRRAFTERSVDRYSGSRKAIGDDVYRAALSGIGDNQGGYAHYGKGSVNLSRGAKSSVLSSRSTYVDFDLSGRGRPRRRACC